MYIIELLKRGTSPLRSSIIDKPTLVAYFRNSEMYSELTGYMDYHRISMAQLGKDIGADINIIWESPDQNVDIKLCRIEAAKKPFKYFITSCPLKDGKWGKAETNYAKKLFGVNMLKPIKSILN